MTIILLALLQLSLGARLFDFSASRCMVTTKFSSRKVKDDRFQKFRIKNVCIDEKETGGKCKEDGDCDRMRECEKSSGRCKGHSMDKEDRAEKRKNCGENIHGVKETGSCTTDCHCRGWRICERGAGERQGFCQGTA